MEEHSLILEKKWKKGREGRLPERAAGGAAADAGLHGPQPAALHGASDQEVQGPADRRPDGPAEDDGAEQGVRMAKCAG